MLNGCQILHHPGLAMQIGEQIIQRCDGQHRNAVTALCFLCSGKFALSALLTIQCDYHAAGLRPCSANKRY